MQIRQVHTLSFAMFSLSLGHAMFQAASHWPVKAEARVWSQGNVCVICDGKSGIGTGYCPRTFVLPCWHYYPDAPYKYFVHLPPTLHDLRS